MAVEYDPYAEPPLVDLIFESIKEDPDSAAELIESALGSINNAFKQTMATDRHVRKHLRDAQSALNDIYTHDSQDPSANGWVGDNGLP